MFRLIIVAFAMGLVSCSVPKVMNQSGRVTPKGNITGGISYMGNVSQEPVKRVSGLVGNFINDFQPTDSVNFNQVMEDANAALVAYTLDPIIAGPQFYVKIGVYDRLEVGYLRTEVTNAFSFQFQFLGFEKEYQEQSKKRWFGSVGMQYSQSKFSLPDRFGELQRTFGYRFGRNDFLFPLNFSYSLGPNEQYGAIGFGAVLGLHRLNYSFIPDKVFDENGVQLQPLQYKNRYHSLGFFLNAKLGFKYVYVIPSLAVYYQNYGEYPMLNRNMVNFQGFSFVPAITLQLNTAHAFGWNLKALFESMGE